MSTEHAIKWQLVAESDMLPLYEGKRVRFESCDIALFNLGDGNFKAIDNACPHKQGPLSDGIVAGDNVFCPLHGWRIHLDTGCAAGEKAQVKSYPVKVHEGKVYVAFEEGTLKTCS